MDYTTVFYDLFNTFEFHLDHMKDVMIAIRKVLLELRDFTRDIELTDIQEIIVADTHELYQAYLDYKGRHKFFHEVLLRAQERFVTEPDDYHKKFAIKELERFVQPLVELSTRQEINFLITDAYVKMSTLPQTQADLEDIRQSEIEEFGE